MNNVDNKDLKTMIEENWKKNFRTWIVTIFIIASVVSYGVLMMIIYYSTSLNTPLDLIAELSLFAVLTGIVVLLLRLLGRLYIELKRENNRMLAKQLDAYNSLLETEVKLQKKKMEKEDKEDKEDKKDKDGTIPDLENTLKIGDLMLKIKECDSKFKIDVAFDEWFDKNKEKVFEDLRNIVKRTESKEITSEKTSDSKDEK